MGPFLNVFNFAGFYQIMYLNGVFLLLGMLNFVSLASKNKYELTFQIAVILVRFVFLCL